MLGQECTVFILAHSIFYLRLVSSHFIFFSDLRCKLWVVDTDAYTKLRTVEQMSRVTQLVHRRMGLEFMLVGSCFSGMMLLGFLAKDLYITQVPRRALGISLRLLQPPVL